MELFWLASGSHVFTLTQISLNQILIWINGLVTIRTLFEDLSLVLVTNLLTIKGHRGVACVWLRYGIVNTWKTGNFLSPEDH